MDEIFLGERLGSIVLWEPGSVINWIARADNYPTKEDALKAAYAMHHAAEQWNKVMGGRVRFQYVSQFDNACFKLEYGGDSGDNLALAFLPDDWQNSLNTVYVYKLLLEPPHRQYMMNTMLHELGHVLGMKHEHSHSGTDWLPPDDTEYGPESIIYGPRNPKSVMAYYEGQTIQDTDAEYIRRAYDELDDGAVIKGRAMYGFVEKTVRRVEPNN